MLSTLWGPMSPSLAHLGLKSCIFRWKFPLPWKTHSVFAFEVDFYLSLVNIFDILPYFFKFHTIYFPKL